MYSNILVPIDGSKPADKALDHAINLIKSVSNTNNNRPKTQLVILFVISDLPIPLGFDKPMRSLKTEKMVTFSDYIKEMHEAMKSNALQMLSEKKKKYESIVSNNNTLIKTEVIVGNGVSVSDVIIDIANKEKSDLIVLGNVGLKESGLCRLETRNNNTQQVLIKIWADDKGATFTFSLPVVNNK